MSTATERAVHLHLPKQPHAVLQTEPVLKALSALRGEGYRWLHVEGDEPLAHPQTLRIVAHAKALGYRAAMVFKAWPGQARTAAAMDLLDGIEVQLAPRPADLADLPRRALKLAERGATAIRLITAPNAPAAEMSRLYVLAMALRECLPGGVRSDCNVAPAQALWQRRAGCTSLLGALGGRTDQHSLADLVHPLVITGSGALRPFSPDVDPRLDLCDVEECNALALRRWRRDRLRELAVVVGQSLNGLHAGRGMVDWSGHLARHSHLRLPGTAFPQVAPRGLAPLALGLQAAGSV